METLVNKSYIWVKFQKEGIHRYPLALTEIKLETVKFLGNDHRHIFHFKVQLEVFHDDRDVEFIMFKRELERLYDVGAMMIDHKSCEMLARDLHDYVATHYPGRDITIDVSEDNENGCSLTWLH
jgi:hypothetical protein